jgi:acetyltransferase EpsM
MKKLVIFGGSGIGMIAASIAEDIGSHEVLGFLNDAIPEGNEIGKYKKHPVIGKTEKYLELLTDPNIDFFIAYVGLQNEKETFEKIKKFKIPKNRWATLIHPSAVIPEKYCSIGNGVLIAPLAQLSPDVTLNDHCILLANSFVGHDSTLDVFAHIATNGVVGANVHVGKAVHIGSNSTVREKIHIGDFALVGSGSVILNDVPSNSIFIGNPGRLLRTK